MEISIIAGAVASALFAIGTFPKLVKVWRTKNATSYSLGDIALGNLGNVIYLVYVVHLPVGPVWALHGFQMTSSALMLFFYLRYVILRDGRARRGSPDGAARDHLALLPSGMIRRVRELTCHRLPKAALARPLSLTANPDNVSSTALAAASVVRRRPVSQASSNADPRC